MPLPLPAKAAHVCFTDQKGGHLSNTELYTLPVKKTLVSLLEKHKFSLTSTKSLLCFSLEANLNSCLCPEVQESESGNTHDNLSWKI